MSQLRNLNVDMPGGMRRLGRWDAGVRGDAIPANPSGNPPWMYPSLQLPGDAADRFAYWVVSTTLPFGLPLADDSTGVIPGLPEGTYTATVRLYENDVALSPDFVVTITVAGAAPSPPQFSPPRARVVLGAFVITIEPLA